ncbi:MAG: hypothetical protein GX552_06025 [Chloroflexi bacterium]|jgi:hypothetical protein|nr:hypothetical protein [Chloroflexota bacterium]
MATFLAFASLPFGLRGGEYQVATAKGMVTVYISDLSYSPFLTISSRPELAQAIPKSGEGDGFTSYTWYDHPFVLRVLFGRNVASLGAINSCATVAQPIPEGIDLKDERALGPLREAFAQVALTALNNVIAVVRRKARLYHILDLRRDEIDISIRNEHGTILREDPLQVSLSEAEKEEALVEDFDLLQQSGEWYDELRGTLGKPDPVTLAHELVMEAERALSQRLPRQAITTCHTALETATSALLTWGMRRRDVPDRQLDNILATKSLTSKLDGLLRQYTGFSMKRDQRALWKAFNQFNDLRNDVVHRGKYPSSEDAEFAVSTTRSMLDWLDMVRDRQK